MNKKLIVLSALVVLLVLPISILAFGHPDTPSGSAITNFDEIILNVLDLLWLVAVVFFIVMFVIAGFKFATAAGEPEAVASARNSVIYGTVGIVVAIIAFSIVTLVQTEIL